METEYFAAILNFITLRILFRSIDPNKDKNMPSHSISAIGAAKEEQPQEQEESLEL
jgi:hypothetical protein